MYLRNSGINKNTAFFSFGHTYQYHSAGAYSSTIRCSVENYYSVSEEIQCLHLNTVFYFYFSCKSQQPFSDVVIVYISITQRLHGEVVSIETHKNEFLFFLQSSRMPDIMYIVQREMSGFLFLRIFSTSASYKTSSQIIPNLLDLLHVKRKIIQ